MSDLTERLRSGFGGMVPPVCDEAANEIESLQRRLGDAEDAVTVWRREATGKGSKLEGFSKRVSDLGYDDLDDMIAVLRRNFAWLEAIQEAKNRCDPITKPAYQALMSAIEEPPK